MIAPLILALLAAPSPDTAESASSARRGVLRGP